MIQLLPTYMPPNDGNSSSNVEISSKIFLVVRRLRVQHAGSEGTGLSLNDSALLSLRIFVSE